MGVLVTSELESNYESQFRSRTLTEVKSSLLFLGKRVNLFLLVTLSTLYLCVKLSLALASTTQYGGAGEYLTHYSAVMMRETGSLIISPKLCAMLTICLFF